MERERERDRERGREREGERERETENVCVCVHEILNFKIFVTFPYTLSSSHEHNIYTPLCTFASDCSSHRLLLLIPFSGGL